MNVDLKTKSYIAASAASSKNKEVWYLSETHIAPTIDVCCLNMHGL